MNQLELMQSKIYEIRGQRVMMDRDLADLYQVATGNLNKAVKRNIKRFPPDFMFQLTEGEFDVLKMPKAAERPRRRIGFVIPEDEQ